MADPVTDARRDLARATTRERERAVWTPVEEAGRALRQAELAKRAETPTASQAARDASAKRSKVGQGA